MLCQNKLSETGPDLLEYNIILAAPAFTLWCRDESGSPQTDINPEIYNSLSPEEVAIKSITPDIWGEGDKGQPGRGSEGL